MSNGGALISNLMRLGQTDLYSDWDEKTVQTLVVDTPPKNKLQSVVIVPNNPDSNSQCGNELFADTSDEEEVIDLYRFQLNM